MLLICVAAFVCPFMMRNLYNEIRIKSALPSGFSRKIVFIDFHIARGAYDRAFRCPLTPFAFVIPRFLVYNKPITRSNALKGKTGNAKETR